MIKVSRNHLQRLGIDKNLSIPPNQKDFVKWYYKDLFSLQQKQSNLKQKLDHKCRYSKENADNPSADTAKALQLYQSAYITPPTPFFFFSLLPSSNHFFLGGGARGKKLCCNKQLHPYGFKNKNKYTTTVAYLPKYIKI